MATTIDSAAGLDQAHRAFRSDLRKLSELIASSSEGSLEQVQVQLGAVRGHASEHFRLEEQSEWMNQLAKRGPNLTKTMEHLRQEHRDLTQAVDTLLDVVKTSTRLDDTLREKIHHWIDRVLRHEAHEDDLIQVAYNRDLGAAD